MLLDHPMRRRDGLLALAAALLPSLAARAGNLVDAPAGLVWPAALADEAVALLAAAADHGLEPLDYGAETLASRLATGPADEALTATFERFLADLAFGRIDPHTIHHEFSVAPRAGFDPAAALRAAIAHGRLADAVDAAVPPLPLYGALRRALASMRALSGHAAWAQRLAALPVPRRARSGKLEPGQPWPGLPALAERLALLGDLPPGTAAPAAYEGALVEAVRGFQQRHGLETDGVLGRATVAALEVPPAERARQIALTMERLRWTPLTQGPRMIVINIPEYVLRAYEVVDGAIRVQAEMRVIVGEAMDHETPLFDERMRSIEFSPYWNVPPSIARAETIPRLRREPGYWTRQGFEFVGAGGVDTVLTQDKLDAVRAGQLRIRQRPGPANALGDIKFVFPNRDHIFLHHTPTVGLFARERRDFSHGCIRVEDPVALARFAMAGMPGWDEARIRAQMAAGTSTTIPLAEPIPVLIAYGTVLVKKGRIYFYDDVYGHDARLQAALDARRVNQPSEEDTHR
ncbi:L,D-transpeptidase family protein [Ideonella sp.]|uniref:L,D-transpeptidase family protein n=1 Tax=Ideonella sp. TaxID=1929293 RepID=UPI002B466923|nr:L,D-transpeptidase family protein [Ideonella sp.]HJV68774.1 L,D-transpeptidase family protein [Ideonella sp.]